MQRGRPRVVLVNTHSTLNPGDTAIVLAQIQLLKSSLGDIELTLTSRTPEIDRPFFRPLGVDVLPPLLPAPSVDTGLARKLGRSARSLGDWGSKQKLIEKIREADLVIGSGGGCFYSHRKAFPGPMFFQNYLPVKLAQRLGKPVIFAPQSFGPFFNPAASRFLKDILTGPSLVKVFVREETSEGFLRSLLRGEESLKKVELCPDLALALEVEDARREGAAREIAGPKIAGLPRPVVALTLRPWDFPEGGVGAESRRRRRSYLAAMEEACLAVYSRWGGSVVVFPQVHGPGAFEDDRPVSGVFWERISRRLPAAHLAFVASDGPRDPVSIVHFLAQADCVIATRFHSALFGFLAGTPAIAIGYQPKAAGVMRLLDLESFCLDIDSLCRPIVDSRRGGPDSSDGSREKNPRGDCLAQVVRRGEVREGPGAFP